MNRIIRIILISVLFSAVSCDTDRGRQWTLEDCYIEEIGEWATCGTLAVFENRSVRKGHEISLNFIILHARTDHPALEPVFCLSGGPGIESRLDLLAGS